VLLSETPVEQVSALRVGAASLDPTVCILHHALGRLHIKGGLGWPAGREWLEVEYVGGFDPLPADLALVFVDMVRRQLSAMGASLGASAAGGGTATGGAPIKGVSIGNLRVEYAVQSAGADEVVKASASPLSEDGLKTFAFVLDLYRTHRTLMAAG
jgi:hypothetical protein